MAMKGVGHGGKVELVLGVSGGNGLKEFKLIGVSGGNGLKEFKLIGVSGYEWTRRGEGNVLLVLRDTITCS